MKLGKIAVITKNEELARFFQLEFFACGYEVYVCESDFIEDKYDLIVIDEDSCQIPHKIYCPTATVSYKYDTVISKEQSTLSWPVALESINELCRIMQKFSGSDGKISFRNTVFVIDESKYKVSIEGEYIKLSQNEYAILCELCSASGFAVKRERIMEILGATNGNISDVYIYHLRRKLEGSVGRRLIFAERGIGYRTVLELQK